ncbi:MAG TPA: phosphomannose isomerase type II C-terminal cupin domain [Nocardioides sp.]|uniref:phosphomannose isomerase type II C-terminal cupin domain n=1 Tax=uncultured Nocardioides sp. TaxID=198441 RepID=UPI002622580F|nr:phosphomannose isomerase type II C-terminal cupin domain [uncultured Nocardioides sp.]HRD64021.1 phosphomannose isomerase type II C-terminal cupin domain [Nocardioides sp.]HRI98749.1 phosphomannose isomerase type II C-terminal cupin domain [Nocardioides sp.]HRK48411.1 phosphomannose isomerase type II C-terminal cupin domain [Nocardioides sp.]
MALSEDRPWGSWHVIDSGDGFKVKRIEVLPHSRLSYQFHEKRAEHWVVVAGKATCTIDGHTVVAGPGDFLDVGIGQAHRIANEDDDVLIVIEVQLGQYTGEDDIVRLEDDYGRNDD